jgi:hypothetical protein
MITAIYVTSILIVIMIGSVSYILDKKLNYIKKELESLKNIKLLNELYEEAK